LQVPVYGSVGNSQFAMNDEPLEFGCVIEAGPLNSDSHSSHGQTFSGESYVQNTPVTQESDHNSTAASG